MVAVSHFAFVNPGGPLVPDLAKAKAYGITRLYWEARDPQINAGLFQGIRASGYEVGVMRDPSWDNLSAIDLARELDADLLRLGSSNAQCAVLADIEVHSPDYVRAFLTEWRELRPSRVTGWTLEPLQGGWMDARFVQAVSKANVWIHPQSYYGNMSPVDPDLVRADLVERGFRRELVSPVYNAAHIPTHWDGIAFRFDQLP
jgi:hypothetical protein